MLIKMFLLTTAVLRLSHQSVPASVVHRPFIGVSHAFARGITDVLTASLQRLDHIVLGVDKQLAHIHASANHTACFDDYLVDVTTLVTCVQGEILTCITDVITEIEISVATVARHAGDAVDIVQSTVATVTACVLESRLTASSCIVETIADAEDAMAELDVALQDAVLSAQEAHSSAPQSMSVCATRVLQVAKVDAQQIVARVAQCVVDDGVYSEQPVVVRPPTEDLTVEPNNYGNIHESSD